MIANPALTSPWHSSNEFRVQPAKRRLEFVNGLREVAMRHGPEGVAGLEGASQRFAKSENPTHTW